MSIADKSYRLLRTDLFVYAMRLVTSVVVARKLGPEGMGIWMVLLLIPSLAEAVGRLKLDVGAVYFLAKKRCSPGEMNFILAVTALASATVCIAVILAFRPYIIAHVAAIRDGDSLLLYAILPSIPLQFLMMNYVYLLLAKEDVEGYNMVSILNNLLGNVLSIAGLFFFNAGLLELTLAFVAGQAGSLAFAAWRFGKDDPLVFRFDRALFREMLGYSKNLYVSGAINYLSQYVSSFIVAGTMISSHMAFFQTGMERVKLLNKIPDMMGTIIYPALSKSVTAAERERLAAKCFRVSLVITTLAGLAAAILIKPAIYVLYGSRFMPVSDVFLILLPTVIVWGTTRAVDQFFLASGKPELLVKVSMASFVLQAGLLYVFINLMGYMGAAIAVALSFLGDALLRMWLFFRHAETTVFWNFIPGRTDYNIVRDFVRGKLKEYGARRAAATL